MKHHKLIIAAAGTALALGSAALAADAPNPFAAPSPLPLQAPPFDRIKDSDYQPALDEGMRQQLAEVDQIANAKSAPTFENTIAALEKSGRMLDRASQVFDAVVQANTNDLLDKVEREEAPKRAAHRDAIYLNAKLFARVMALYDQRAKLDLDAEALQVLTIYYDDFVRAGARLSAADQVKLRELNGKIATLETGFGQKLTAATKEGALILDNAEQLAGLSPGERAAAAKAAEDRGLKGKYAISLQNTTQQPDLNSLIDRTVRERLFNSSWRRTERNDANDTRETVGTLARLRAEKAQLLGYPTYAAYALTNQMAKTPEAVLAFLGQFAGPIAAKTNADAPVFEKAMTASPASAGPGFALAPWDWMLASEKVRKTQFDLDENQIKPYFELDNVMRNGVFYAANRLYGLTFKERKDLPVYHPDVRVFDVIDQDGSQLGLMYFDYFKRDNKSGGAWMNNFVGQSKLLGTKPVIYNVASFPKPAPGEPALLTYDDVKTMFHEFGHALHGLFAAETYPLISGTNTARDWVEFPSQFNENWALYPSILQHYAVHHKTGAAMPQALIDKIKKAATFNQGYQLGESLAAASLDMQWHILKTVPAKIDVDAFETTALANAHMNFAHVPPRYRSSYFRHIWSNGYAAAYYAYSWTEMLEHDAFAWFERNGGLTRANGQRFRDMILSRGHSGDYAVMYRAFAGKDPEVGPMLAFRGLTAAKP